MKDLFEFFYGPTSGYFPGVVERLQAGAQQRMADVAYMRELDNQANQALKDMELISGVPRGSLGAKW